jgi:two-component system sensor histidine kinase DevS
MSQLHRATLSLFADLSLDGVLGRILKAAKDLVGARFAALGIPDESGGLEIFLTSGLSDEEVRNIPHLPEGKGLIGEMMREGRSIRIPRIQDHPRSAGFPPGHPEMESFLGVPISAYGRPLGQLYLTDKQEAPEFSAEDQRLIEMLASHAAAAIENARLYRQVLNSEMELTQRNMQLELINSLASMVSSATNIDDLIEIMLARVMQLFGAGAGEIFLREEETGDFRMAIHRGEAEQAFWQVDRFKVGEGFIGRVAKQGELIWTTDLAEEPNFLRKDIVEAGFGTLVCVPLTAPGKVVGVLSLAFFEKRELHKREVGLLEAVGSGIGVAIENARLYRQAQRLAVLEERERIGMDLHDGIIQSIYAVGLNLEYSRLLVEEDAQQTGTRLQQAIEDLNKVIGDLRSYILDLQPSRMSADDLSTALTRLVREFEANTKTGIDLEIDPDAVARVGESTANGLYLIAQEALANVAKHAQASEVSLSLEASNDHIDMQVVDNGKGFDIEGDTDVLGHGLSNMRERARRIGGRLQVRSNSGEGTRVSIRLKKDNLPREKSAKPDLTQARGPG